jgi:hypothetical protein
MRIFKKKTVKNNKNKNVTIIRESSKNLSTTNMANNYIPSDDTLIVVDNEDGTYQLKMGDGKTLYKNLKNIARSSSGDGAGGSITDIEDAIDQEVENRNKAINDAKTALQGNIDNETDARKKADKEITDKLTDLENSIPTVPASISQLTDDVGIMTKNKVDSAIADAIPENLSAFTNDQNYQTKDQLDNAIADAIAGVTEYEYKIVDTLPTAGEKGTIYLLNEDGNYTQNIWMETEYITTSAKVDLSGYAKTTDVQSLVDEAGKNHADITKANSFSEINDFKAITVHTAEYTPDQTTAITGVGEYQFKRRLIVGETIDTGIPCAAIASVTEQTGGIFTIDRSGTNIKITGAAVGSDVLGIQTHYGYLMSMNFYCIASSAANARNIALVKIEGITNGQAVKVGSQFKVSSIIYTNDPDQVANLPTGDVGDIFCNNSEYGDSGCSIAYSGANWGGQTYTVNGVEYTNMSRCYFSVHVKKAGIYTLSGFYRGMGKNEDDPIADQSEGLTTSTLTFVATNSGDLNEYDKIDVEDSLVKFDNLTSKFKADFYETHKFVMSGNGIYGSTSNVMMATGKGDKKTYFNLENDFDVSRITVDDASKEYATFDFTNKCFTYIKSTSSNTPLEISVMLDGTEIGKAYINFTSAHAVSSTDINYETNEPKGATDYNNISNKPSINGVELSGNKSGEDLGIHRMVIDLMYPVGSIYMSLLSSFDPNTSWVGTTWEKIKDGVFLESNATPGTETEAGLPNITGIYGNRTGGYVPSGAFYQSDTTGYQCNTAIVSGAGNVSIDASRSSAVYGNSTTVQPHSITVVMWKRTA